MTYTVCTRDLVPVGPAVDNLSDAQAIMEANDGYSKGWFIRPINESNDVPVARPQFLTEG